MISSEAVRGEILDVHIAIEQCFTGQTGRDGLDALLKRFSDDFSLISPAGASLDKPAVRALFERLHATRPGFRITIGDVATRDVGADHMLAIYREDQIDAAGTHTARVSTALLEEREGALIWLHLHETWVPET